MPPYSYTSHIHGNYMYNGLRGRQCPSVPACQQLGEVPLRGSSELCALRRRDPSIVSTFDWCDGVRCVLDGDQGEKQRFEGRMIIYERETYPVYGFCIVNEHGTIVHIQHLYPEDEISDHSNGLKIKSYPDFTAHGLSLTRSSSTTVVQKMSDIYRIPDLESLHGSSKGVPTIVELLAVTEDMIRVLKRLYSYVQMNKPYPKEFLSGSNRIPTLFFQYTSYSPSASEPLLGSRSTSPSLSTPSTSNPTSPLQCTPMVQLIPRAQPYTDPAHDSPGPADTPPFPGYVVNNDSRHIALLDSLLPMLPTAMPRSTTDCPLAGSRTATLFLSRNSSGPIRRSKASRSQQMSGSRLAKSIDTSDPTLSSEAVASTNQLLQCSATRTVRRASSLSNVHQGEMPTNLDASIDLQPCPDLCGQFHKADQYSFARGGFSDVYRGKSTTCTDDNITVVIKIIRIPGFRDDDHGIVDTIKTRLDHDSKIWNTLCHPNVLPFLGISREFGPFPALISPYCPSRDVVHYLKHHSHVDRKPIALGLTSGLRYLHSQNVIHGDLKGSNVLIGPNGEPLICDFGVSRIIDCRGFTTRPVGTPFMAPELFPDVYMVLDEEAVDNDVSPFCPEVTKETDVYAYALVLLQVLISEDPKPHNGYFVAQKARLLPKRRSYSPMSDQLWDLVETCCHLDPKRRPSMIEVMRILSMVMISRTTLK